MNARFARVFIRTRTYVRERVSAHSRETVAYEGTPSLSPARRRKKERKTLGRRSPASSFPSSSALQRPARTFSPFPATLAPLPMSPPTGGSSPATRIRRTRKRAGGKAPLHTGSFGFHGDADRICGLKPSYPLRDSSPCEGIRKRAETVGNS